MDPIYAVFCGIDVGKAVGHDQGHPAVLKALGAVRASSK